jgi:methenyltetrahydrofolate cyclohydrolase
VTAVNDESIGAYIDQVASAAAVPGGGSAAAVAAALGAALTAMVARISAKKAADDGDRQRLLEAVAELDRLRTDLVRLSQEDIDAYRSVLETRKAAAESSVIGRAIEGAAIVPLETAKAAARARAISDDVGAKAWSMTRSDWQVGRDLLTTGLRGALANVEVNLADLRGEARDRIERAYREVAATVADPNVSRG